MNLKRVAAAALAATVVAIVAPAARAAEPYEINVILPLTGSTAFVGSTQQTAIKAVQDYVNKSGGIDGRPVSFVFADDQSDPKTSLQLAQGLIAKNVPVILGPSSPQDCAAIQPLIEAKGPVFYCLANSGHPTTGGYEFLTLFPYEAQFAVTYRYFRQRGLKKIAYIVSTDGGGQEAEAAMLSQAALPENKDLVFVDKEHFAPGDISVAAQMARIKAANPDVVVYWATGAAAGTLFRSARDAGIDLPSVTSGGNMSANFFKQFGPLLPTNLYFAAVPYYAGDAVNAPATNSAIVTLTTSLAAVNAKPDMIQISAWDPAMVVVDALRKIGPNATAAQLRTYMNGLRGWTGVNGSYDYKTNPQRGVGENNVVMVRWDQQANKGIAVSKLGGAPIGK
ncbi:MAG: ABC transporter substrate-binding protein [Candidatus Lustribacter sp.]|jgi:branched-chain amino acid transport system substrate-binding protein